MIAQAHNLNWYAGWSLVLASFLVGAAVGLFFHRDGFLGGYDSFRRRLVRLGHIALAALGMLNLIHALGPCTSRVAGWLFAIGGIGMPAVCFLTAWREPFRHLFFVPVLALVAAVALTLCGRDGPLGRPPVVNDTARLASAPCKVTTDLKVVGRVRVPADRLSCPPLPASRSGSYRAADAGDGVPPNDRRQQRRQVYLELIEAECLPNQEHAL